MQYLELKFSQIISEDQQSMLIAELMDLGFESFSEEENAVLAYISSDLYNDTLLNSVKLLKDHPEIKISIHPIENKNWNKEWESNYQPVTIAGKCHVRASFHPPVTDLLYEIIIEPKMAFGTAHHETTRLMAEWLMNLEVKGKDVLDMGCGTGILAVIANKMGAGSVIGIDNDEWAWRNAQDNFRLNGMSEEIVFLGDVTMIGTNAFDMVLANINRNVLLQDLNAYFKSLRNKGNLLISGFYLKDIDLLKEEAAKCGFHFAGSGNLNDWAVLLFYK